MEGRRLRGQRATSHPSRRDLDLGLVERIAAAALDEPTRHAAARFLLRCRRSSSPSSRVFGTRAWSPRTNSGDGVPLRPDWDDHCADGTPLLARRGRGLVEQLGFTVTAGPTSTSVLSVGSTKRAVAVFLDENEEFEQAANRFGAPAPCRTRSRSQTGRASLGCRHPRPPDPPLLLEAGRRRGSQGPAETYVEANLALLPDAGAGYLPLLFSADALVATGRSSRSWRLARFAADLGARLRDRVYEDAVPHLALALARRRAGELDDAELEALYEQALTILFRLLFVAYAEDKDLLPYRSNGGYHDHALKTLARRLAERGRPDSSVRRERDRSVGRRGLAVASRRQGNAERGVPRYNGGLFSATPT